MEYPEWQAVDQTTIMCAALTISLVFPLLIHRAIEQAAVVPVVPLPSPSLSPSASSHEFQLIMNVLYQRLKESGSNWRYVYKARSGPSHCRCAAAAAAAR